MTKAAIRRHIEKIEGVSRTWIEWQSGPSGMEKALVVEVNFDTDPNSDNYQRPVLDAIEDTAKMVLEDTTMIISHLRIIPKV